jgi:ABC-2 type transporter
MSALFWKVCDYFDDDRKISQAETLNLVGTLFFICIDQTMANMLGTITIFCDERPVFLREQANAMYGILPYYLTKTLFDLPMNRRISKYESQSLSRGFPGISIASCGRTRDREVNVR